MDKAKRIIFLDLDGTLLDIDKRWYRLHVDLAKYYGFDPIPEKKYVQAKKNNISEIVIIKETNIDPNKMNSYLKKRIESLELRKYLLFNTVKPGVIPFLRNLSKKYRLVLVTKRTTLKNCLTELKKNKLISYFSKILITQKEEKYTIIILHFNKSELKNSLLIGDTEDDYITAKKLHITSILVADGSRSKKILGNYRADYIVDTISKIYSILD